MIMLQVTRMCDQFPCLLCRMPLAKIYPCAVVMTDLNPSQDRLVRGRSATRPTRLPFPCVFFSTLQRSELRLPPSPCLLALPCSLRLPPYQWRPGSPFMEQTETIGGGPAVSPPPHLPTTGAPPPSCPCSSRRGLLPPVRTRLPSPSWVFAPAVLPHLWHLQLPCPYWILAFSIPWHRRESVLSEGGASLGAPMESSDCGISPSGQDPVGRGTCSYVGHQCPLLKSECRFFLLVRR